MSIINIDVLKTKKIVTGAACPKCGGEIVPFNHKPLSGKIIKAMSLGFIKPKTYQCTACKKTIQVF